MSDEDGNGDGDGGGDGTSKIPCRVCPEGTMFTTQAETCQGAVDSAAMTMFAETDQCAEMIGLYQSICCPEAIDDSCVICREGVTINTAASVSNDAFDQLDDAAKIQLSQDCQLTIDSASSFGAANSEGCLNNKFGLEPACCPTLATNPCSPCPEGMTLNDEAFFLEEMALTCGFVASVTEDGSNECELAKEGFEEAGCCVPINGNEGCVNPDPISCGCRDVDQADYRGSISVTSGGFECLRWDSLEVIESTGDVTEWAEAPADLALEEYSDYCRNPSPSMFGDLAWCFYLNDEGVLSSAACDVPFCEDVEGVGSPSQPNTTPAPTMSMAPSVAGDGSAEQPTMTAVPTMSMAPSGLGSIWPAPENGPNCDTDPTFSPVPTVVSVLSASPSASFVPSSSSAPSPSSPAAGVVDIGMNGNSNENGMAVPTNSPTLSPFPSVSSAPSQLPSASLMPSSSAAPSPSAPAPVDDSAASSNGSAPDSNGTIGLDISFPVDSNSTAVNETLGGSDDNTMPPSPPEPTLNELDLLSAPFSMSLSMEGGSVDSRYGFSVASSSDGSLVAVGAMDAVDETGQPTGAVYLYSVDASSNSFTLLQKIFGPSPGGQFGNAVSMSGSGDRLAVGSRSENGQMGAMRIYGRRSTGIGTDAEWSLMENGEMLSQTERGRSGEEEDGISSAGWGAHGSIESNLQSEAAGYSLSMSDNGFTMVIGFPRATNDDDLANAGKAAVYYMDGSQWQQLGQEVYGQSGGDVDGTSVAMSRDGSNFCHRGPGP
ncbi:hypothetical protein ACHAWF_016870 [Thalassiosira exigua]